MTTSLKPLKISAPTIALVNKEAQPTVQGYGENVSGKISDEQRKDTTNIMASAIEVMGMSLPCRSTGLELTSNDFQKVSEVLFLAYVHKTGGTLAVIRYLLDHKYLDGDCVTVTGKTLAENAESYPRLPDGQVLGRMLLCSVTVGPLEVHTDSPSATYALKHRGLKGFLKCGGEHVNESEHFCGFNLIGTRISSGRLPPSSEHALQPDNQTDGQAALDDSVAVRGVCEEFRNGLCCQGNIDKNGDGNESLA
ncbi:hypothetical protein V6N12_061392 [Hibiscus sabdariffa]|uniref:Uncharacterized protein n=1 Tax=Hibiscus sabdariffa TaxID=183260 RepID=A0ABR2DWX5_9ROSI